MSSKCTLLGSGNSTGVPLLGCTCFVCQLPSSYARRRAAALIESENGEVYLIDCGPDIREQLLKARLKPDDLIAILLTHKHEDHIGGFEELRPLVYRRTKPLLCYSSQETYDSLAERLKYLWSLPNSWISQVQFHILNEKKNFLLIGKTKIIYFSYQQPGATVMGFRFGTLAYITDIKTYSQEIYTHLNGIDTLILGMVQWLPNAMHFFWEDVKDFIAPLCLQRVILTHMSHLIDPTSSKTFELLSQFPHVELGHDGLVIEFISHSE